MRVVGWVEKKWSVSVSARGCKMMNNMENLKLEISMYAKINIRHLFYGFRMVSSR